MKTNEARPFFRVLALLLAIPAWSIAIIIAYHSVKESSLEHTEWKVLGTLVVGGLAFSYVALTGYMPKFLLHLFSRGPVADDRNYR